MNCIQAAEYKQHSTIICVMECFVSLAWPFLIFPSYWQYLQCSFINHVFYCNVRIGQKSLCNYDRIDELQGGGGGGGEGEETRPETEKRCSQNLQLQSARQRFYEGRENFPQ